MGRGAICDGSRFQFALLRGGRMSTCSNPEWSELLKAKGV